jgi:hypothetical protein
MIRDVVAPEKLPNVGAFPFDVKMGTVGIAFRQRNDHTLRIVGEPFLAIMVRNVETLAEAVFHRLAPNAIVAYAGPTDFSVGSRGERPPGGIAAGLVKEVSSLFGLFEERESYCKSFFIAVYVRFRREGEVHENLLKVRFSLAGEKC